MRWHLIYNVVYFFIIRGEEIEIEIEIEIGKETGTETETETEKRDPDTNGKNYKCLLGTTSFPGFS